MEHTRGEMRMLLRLYPLVWFCSCFSASTVSPLEFGHETYDLVLTNFAEWKGRTDGLVPHVFFESGPNFPVAVFAFSIDG